MRRLAFMPLRGSDWGASQSRVAASPSWGLIDTHAVTSKSEGLLEALGEKKSGRMSIGVKLRHSA